LKNREAKRIFARISRMNRRGKEKPDA